VRDGTAHAEAGRHGEALKSYLSAAAIDDRHAELQFRIARTHWALGDFAAARQSFAQARELDALRFRADTRINAIIRAVAGSAGPGVDLVDSEAKLAVASEQGVPGAELFWEHVHLTPRGNYLLARELFPSVVAALPDAVRGASALAEPLSQEESDRLLALTDFDQRRVTSMAASWVTQPPFTNQLGHMERVAALQRQATSGETDFVATAAVYRAAIAKAPGDRWLHLNFGLFLKEREPAAAMAEFRRALEINSGDYAARQELGETLIRTGRFEDGIAECRTILAAKPYHAPAHFAIAVALSHLQRIDEAIGAYEQAMRYHPGYTFIAHRTIGLMRLQQNRYEPAAENLRKAVDAGQGAQDADVLYGLSQALNQLGRHEEAARIMRSAMALRQAAQSQTPPP
jgi:tetratricopeptide (TPR) repeat protein